MDDYNELNGVSSNEDENPIVDDPANEDPIFPDTDTVDVPMETEEAPEYPAEEPEAIGADDFEPIAEEPRQQYPAEEDAQHLWAEPEYERSAVPAETGYSPSHQLNDLSGREKKKKEKKRHPFIRAVCLVLSCALVSGAVSYACVSALLKRQAEAEKANPPSNTVVIGSAQQDTGDRSGSYDNVNRNTFGSMTPQQIYDMACTQVVGVNTSITTNIFGQTTSNAVSGSGFVISRDGYIMTNYHVISYAVMYSGDLTVMFHDGSSYPATIVGYVEDNDVAIIKIDPEGLDLSPVTFGDSSKVVVGQPVYAVGNPLGELIYTMTDGIVSALDRVITTSGSGGGASTSMNMFQISAAVNSGNSGGPVYNGDGEVIGIVTAKYSDSGVEGLGFAIPISDAVNIATQLIENGYVNGASLGITCTSVEDVFSSFTMQYYEYPSGVCVMSVIEGSAADNAGIVQGDIITNLSGTDVKSPDELKMVLRRYAPGETVPIRIFRLSSTLGKGEYVDLEITLGETSALSSVQQEQQEQQSQQSQQQDGWGGYYGFPWYFGR